MFAVGLHTCTAVVHSLCVSWAFLFYIIVIKGHQMLAPPESSSVVLVMICSKSVSVCNHSHARLVDSSRNRTFSRGYPNLMPLYKGLLKPRGSKLTLLKSTFNAANFIRRLSWSICSDFGEFTLEMCVPA